MFNRMVSWIIVGASLAINSACTTTNTAQAPEQSFARLIEIADTATPAASPETTEAKASLAASVEEGVVTETVAFAPADATTTEPTITVQPAIPDTAVEVAVAPPVIAPPVAASRSERECLMRAMYFESNRSSQDGLLAVGTVVMNRLSHGAWGNNVCGVVSAKRQFAPGVLTRKMQGDTSDLTALADAILAGKRHPKLEQNVMFFHVAGMKFPYKNMRYVLVAGGNTFYYKAARRRS